MNHNNTLQKRIEALSGRGDPELQKYLEALEATAKTHELAAPTVSNNPVSGAAAV
jgi:hypothetical protein